MSRRHLAQVLSALVVIGSTFTVTPAAIAGGGCSKSGNLIGSCAVSVHVPASSTHQSASSGGSFQRGSAGSRIGGHSSLGGSGRRSISSSTPAVPSCLYAPAHALPGGASQCTGGGRAPVVPGPVAAAAAVTLVAARNAAPPPPDPRVVAKTAIARMQLRAIDVGIAPTSGTHRMGLIGMPTWMWVDNPTANTWGRISRRVTVGGITATVTAKVNRVVWNMGDGHSVVCDGLGHAYRPWMGKRDSPDCGYHYTRTSDREPHNEFKVTATSHWNITWEGSGQGGTMAINLSRSVPIRIGEMQVLVTG